MINGKEKNIGKDPISVFNDRAKESEIKDKFNELRNSILSILVKRNIILFYVQ